MQNFQPAFDENQTSRIGFHYIPDTYHYGEKDLSVWLPRLTDMGVNWLILEAPSGRAIPETFITGLVSQNIEPVLHFKFSLPDPPAAAQLSTLLQVYARWGVKRTIFFDRPNSRSSWSPRTWSQHNLVERFMDRYIPLARTALDSGLTPVFPPLEPGGDYWDMSFLQSALESLERRTQADIISKITLSALAWTGGHTLDWGAGGPARWTQIRPYSPSDGAEDHRGWHIYEWYLAAVKNLWHQDPALILLQAGIPSDPKQGFSEDFDRERGHWIDQILSRLSTDPAAVDVVPSSVIACCFWLLSGSVESGYDRQAFFRHEGTSLSCVQAFQELARQPKKTTNPSLDPTRPIDHYLLLPYPNEPLPAWKMQLMQPFINKYHPTIGFSLEEAGLARRVTVFADTTQIPETSIDNLRLAGSLVERIETNGISIATEVKER